MGVRRAMKSTEQPPAQAVKKSRSQVLPLVALVGAGLPSRMPCAFNGSRYVFHISALCCGLRFA
jgi:hypothetical protein